MNGDLRSLRTSAQLRRQDPGKFPRFAPCRPGRYHDDLENIFAVFPIKSNGICTVFPEFYENRSHIDVSIFIYGNREGEKMEIIR